MTNADGGKRDENIVEIGQVLRIHIQLNMPVGNLVHPLGERFQPLDAFRPAAFEVKANSPHPGLIERKSLIEDQGSFAIIAICADYVNPPRTDKHERLLSQCAGCSRWAGVRTSARQK